MTAVPRPAPSRGAQVFSSGLWVALGSVLPLAGTALLSVVAGRVLGAELLGQQSLIALVAALLAALVVNALGDATIRTLAAMRAADRSRVGSLEQWSVRAHAVTGLAVGAVVACTGLYRDELVVAWLLAAATVVADALGWSHGNVVIARDGWGQVARRRLVTQLLAIGLGVLGVLTGLGVAGIFLGTLLGSLAFLLAVRPLRPARTPASSALRAARPWRLWLLFSGGALLTQIGSGRVEILFLGSVATGEDIAQYSVAVMLVTAALTLPASVATAALPALAASSAGPGAQAGGDAVVRALRVTAVLSLPLCALLVAVGPELVVGLYGAAFTEAGQLSQSMAAGAVLLPCARLATAYWQGLGQLRPVLLAGTVGALLEVAMAVVLVPSFTAAGAVAATLAGQALAATILLRLTWLRLDRPALGGPRWVAALAVSAVAAGAGYLAGGSDGQVGGGLLGVVVGALTVAVAFVALTLGARRVGLPLLAAGDAAWLADVVPRALQPLCRLMGAAPGPYEGLSPC